MKTGRPAKETTPYKIIVHTNKGYRYASTKIKVVKDDGKASYVHRHWGTVDGQDRFHPNSTYLCAAIDERKKLIFPDNWDLSEIEKLSGNDRRGRMAYDKDDVDRQYGPTWLLDNIADRIGLRADLMQEFDGNAEFVSDILTMAYFPCIDNLTYSHLSQWQREVKTPSDRKLTPKEVTYLCERITEQNRMDPFRCRAKRVGKDELCAVDSTSMSTYGFNLVDIRWGHNKEKLPLRQTLQVVIYSLASQMPIFYMELPGNMPDSRTADLILKQLESAGFHNLILITDRGYESMKNLELYISKRQKVITCVKTTGAEVLGRIKGLDMSQGYPKDMDFDPERKVFYKQYECEYSVKGNGENVIEADRLKLNLYFSATARADGIEDLQTMLMAQKDEIERIRIAGEEVVDDKEFRHMFNLLEVSLDETGTHVKSWKVNEEKCRNKIKAAGFFANKTLGLDYTPRQAMENYGMRDAQEKCFQLEKGPMGQNRMRTYSQAAHRGRLFICFVGLILASCVRSVWKEDAVLSKKFGSTEAVLEEMRTIRCIEHRNRLKFITPFVGAQLEICKAFGFEPPKECAPSYTSKAKSSKAKRGRPAKPKTEAQEI